MYFSIDRKTAAAPYKSIATPSPDDMEYNQEVPNVRSNIKLEYREDRGRLLIANEEIKPGMILDYNNLTIIYMIIYMRLSPVKNIIFLS
jgi:hypothetical protein